MVTSYRDISIVLSGGSGNSDPNQALGGSPSSTAIATGLNNLFSNASPDVNASSVDDYRCVYIFNDGTSVIYDLKLWIYSEVALGSNVKLGLDFQNEIQLITISGNPSGGHFVLRYTTDEGTFSTSNILYDSNPIVLALNIQNALNDLKDSNNNSLLEDVAVAGSISGNLILFQLTFEGADGNKNHEIITAQNSLIGTAPNISISVTQQGSPVNTIAPSLDSDTTSPFGVEFSYPISNNPFIIPKLLPAEGFPLWVKRTTPADADLVESDGFSLAVSFYPFKN